MNTELSKEKRKKKDCAIVSRLQVGLYIAPIGLGLVTCCKSCRLPIASKTCVLGKRVCRILIVQQLSRSEVRITVKHWSLWEQNLVFGTVL